jgi:Short C-terminal domain
MARRVIVIALVVLSSAFAYVTVFTLWANRQFLNTDNWTKTSSQLLESKHVREQVAEFLVDRLYARVNVSGALQQALPQPAKPLAGPIAGGLRNAADEGVQKLLERPKIQLVWEKANHVAHTAFLKAIEGGGKNVSTQNGTVVLHLSQLAATVARQLGLGNVASKIPPDAADITILKAHQLEAVQNALKALRGVSIVVLILWLLFSVAAVVVGVGRRREALRALGFGLIAAGALALLTRTLAGNAIVNALSSTAAVEPAIRDVWSIGTSLVIEAAQSAIAYGVVIALAAWLAGPTRVATRARQGLAPFLADPRWAFGGLAVLFFLLVLWGPTPATRNPLGLLLFAILLAVGVEVLRRQTAEEYPDATFGALGQAGQAGMAKVGGAVSAGGRAVAGKVSGLRSGGGSQSTAEDDQLARLERLGKLRDSGVLDQAEFEAQKKAILAGR